MQPYRSDSCPCASRSFSLRFVSLRRFLPQALRVTSQKRFRLPLSLNAAAHFRESLWSSPQPGESRRVLPSHLDISTSTGWRDSGLWPRARGIPPNCSFVSAYGPSVIDTLSFFH